MDISNLFCFTELSHSCSCVVTSLSTLSVLRSASFNQMLFFSSCSSASLLEHPIFYPFGCQEDAGWWMSGQWSPCHGAKVHRCCQELLKLCRLAMKNHKWIQTINFMLPFQRRKVLIIKRKESLSTLSPSLAEVVLESAHRPPWTIRMRIANWSKTFASSQSKWHLPYFLFRLLFLHFVQNLPVFQNTCSVHITISN